MAPTSYCTSPVPRSDELLLGRRARRVGQYASVRLGRESPPGRTLGPVRNAR